MPTITKSSDEIHHHGVFRCVVVVGTVGEVLLHHRGHEEEADVRYTALAYPKYAPYLVCHQDTIDRERHNSSSLIKHIMKYITILNVVLPSSCLILSSSINIHHTFFARFMLHKIFVKVVFELDKSSLKIGMNMNSPIS